MTDDIDLAPEPTDPPFPADDAEDRWSEPVDRPPSPLLWLYIEHRRWFVAWLLLVGTCLALIVLTLTIMLCVSLVETL